MNTKAVDDQFGILSHTLGEDLGAELEIHFVRDEDPVPVDGGVLG